MLVYRHLHNINLRVADLYCIFPLYPYIPIPGRGPWSFGNVDGVERLVALSSRTHSYDAVFLADMAYNALSPLRGDSGANKRKRGLTRGKD